MSFNQTITDLLRRASEPRPTESPCQVTYVVTKKDDNSYYLEVRVTPLCEDTVRVLRVIREDYHGSVWGPKGENFLVTMPPYWFEKFKKTYQETKNLL